VKRRIPPEILVRTLIIVPLSFFVLTGSLFETHQYGFSTMIIAVIMLFFFVNYGFDWGYQLSFDTIRMYQRPKGWRWLFGRLPWHSIRFDEVSRVEAIFGADATLKARFFNFEFILNLWKNQQRRRQSGDLSACVS
jgi:hypothetical protein